LGKIRKDDLKNRKSLSGIDSERKILLVPDKNDVHSSLDVIDSQDLTKL